MGRKTTEQPRDIVLQLRINKNEKEKLENISKTLNLSYREVFTLAIDIMSLPLEKLNKSENLKK